MTAEGAGPPGGSAPFAAEGIATRFLGRKANVPGSYPHHTRRVLSSARVSTTEEFMRSSTRIRMIAALVLPLAACATGKSSRMNSAKMCQAHGGTYDSTTQMCSQKESQK